MKKNRQELILKLIENSSIETQEELADLLRKNGYRVTQATISRDIRELRLTKIAEAGGKQKYIVMNGHAPHMEDKYVKVFKAGYVSMEKAQNLLIIRTVPGMAMAVAAAIDALQIRYVVGCIAGDDTIFCAVKEEHFAESVMEQLKQML